MFGLIHTAKEHRNIDIGIEYQTFGRAQVYGKEKFFKSDNIFVFVSDFITKLYNNESISKDSQEEKVIELYKKHGPRFVEYCEGLFTIFLFDVGKDKYYVFNNRYQTTNIYYHNDESKIVFGKSLKDILKNFIPNPTPHLGSIKSFISNGFTIPDQTQIEGVLKMLPTYWLEVSEEKFLVKNHWEKEFTLERKPFDNLEKQLDKYEDLYRDGLKSDVRYYTHQ